MCTSSSSSSSRSASAAPCSAPGSWAVQREAGVTHLIAKRLMDDSHLLGGLVFAS